MQVDAALEMLFINLYDNVHNLIVTAEMVEEAIIFGNRYRSSFLEVNTELNKSGVIIIEMVNIQKLYRPLLILLKKSIQGSYEMLINKKAQSHE